MKPGAGVLYITYDGLLEALGQSQVLAYAESLAKNRPFFILSFEKPYSRTQPDLFASVEKRARVAGIHWRPLSYHKTPSLIATAWDILSGCVVGFLLARRGTVRIVHARSYVSAVMALVIKRLLGVKFIFDMRGFWADERVDGNIWSRTGSLYRIAKWFERRFLLRADHVVSLTHAGLREILQFPYMHGRTLAATVIPTCADLSRFRPIPGIRTEQFVLGYVGSAGTWYQFEAAANCFRELVELIPSARLLVINTGEHDFIREKLKEAGVADQNVEIKSVSFSEVPQEMARMHAGMFFIKPVFSKKASAPTKLAEFLGCGLPCLSNSGVGDMEEILEGERVGVAVRSFDPMALRQGLERLLEISRAPDIAQRCVDVARRNFSLEDGVKRYAEIYASLAAGDEAKL